MFLVYFVFQNSFIHQHLVLVRAERDKLNEDMCSLNQVKIENESLIESQAVDIKEMKVSEGINE